MLTSSPQQAAVATLEILAAECPELLDFQVEALLTSSIGRVVEDLAAGWATPPDKLPPVIHAASRHLDKLETTRRAWRDPGQVLDAPNVPALLALCRARMGRVPPFRRRHKLEAIHRKLDRALDHAAKRQWIEGFLGPAPPAPPDSEGG